MNIYSRILLISCLVWAPLFSFSALNYNSNIEKAHMAILNLDSETAEQWLNIEKKNTSQNASPNTYVDYLESYQNFLDVYFKMKPEDFGKFIESSEDCIQKLKGESDISEASVLVSTLYIQRAFIYFLWNESFHFGKSYVLGKNQLDNIDPEHPEYLKLASLYELIGGSIPSTYKPLADLFNFSGVSQKGLSMIQSYLEKDQRYKCQKQEGKIIQIYIEKLLDLHSESADIKFNPNDALLLNYVKLQTQNIKAHEQIKWINTLTKVQSGLPNYFTFLKAKAYLNLQDTKGLKLMDEFIKDHEGLSLKHTAHFYKYWWYLAQGKQSASNAEKEQLLLLPDPLFPLDKKMTKRTAKKQNNAYLIKSRMLFDALEYDEAFIVLKNKDAKSSLKSEAEKIEFLYRLARINEKKKAMDAAIQLYQKVIDTQQSEFYFVAFSAYNLGKIYAQKKNNILAEAYFLEALELNKGEYQQSIENKCNFALEMLKK